VCGRRVPRRVAECFCGAKQTQVEQHQRREADEKSHRVPLDVALILAVLVAGGVYMAHRFVTEPEAEEGRSLFRSVLQTPEAPPTAPPVEALVIPTPLPIATPAIPETRPPSPPPLTFAPEPIATVSPVPLPSPTPAPSPTPDEREALRAKGIQAYSAELSRLAALAAKLRERIGAYREGCFGARTGGGYSNCPDIEADITTTARVIERGLDEAEDQGRRSWVEPGALRRAKDDSYFGTPDWEELQRTARNPRPQ